MKAIVTTLKILLIGCLWSIIFIDGIRVLLLINWRFDIFMSDHWKLLRNSWNSGQPISNSEIALYMVLFSAIPLWLSGWIGLCLVRWQKWLKYVVFGPLFLYRKIKLKTKAPVVIKKKSIKEEIVVVEKTPIIKKAPAKRPPLPSATLMKSNINNNLGGATSYGSTPSTPSYSPLNKKKQEQSAPIDHALFNFDDDDFDLEFDLDKKEAPKQTANEIPSALVVDEPKEAKQETPKANPEKTNKPKPQAQTDKPKKDNAPKKIPNISAPNNKDTHTPVQDVLSQKGYDIIPSVIIKNTTIDYLAVSKNQIIMCLVDREPGDWLADEEKFNDEEPLWFSESSHRISPVRKMDIARDVFKTKLAVADFNFEVVSYVVIQSGNIINAEDMFEIWDSMKINVTRINRGSPKEIQLFSKSVETCEERTDKLTIEKLKKLIYSMA